jgi:hypothetical protein
MVTLEELQRQGAGHDGAAGLHAAAGGVFQARGDRPALLLPQPDQPGAPCNAALLGVRNRGPSELRLEALLPHAERWEVVLPRLVGAAPWPAPLWLPRAAGVRLCTSDGAEVLRREPWGDGGYLDLTA